MYAVGIKYMFCLTPLAVSVWKYSKPSFSPNSIVRIKINANNFLSNAGNSIGHGLQSMVFYQKQNTTTFWKLNISELFRLYLEKTIWFAFFSMCDSANFQLNCHPVISSSVVFTPSSSHQTALSQIDSITIYLWYYYYAVFVSTDVLL